MGECVCVCVCIDRWTADVEAREFVSEGPALGSGSGGEEKDRRKKCSKCDVSHRDTTASSASITSPES